MLCATVCLVCTLPAIQHYEPPPACGHASASRHLLPPAPLCHALEQVLWLPEKLCQDYRLQVRTTLQHMPKLCMSAGVCLVSLGEMVPMLLLCIVYSHAGRDGW